MRLLLCVLLWSSAVTAQMQFLHVDAPGSEKPVSAILAIGSAPVGEVIQTTLRVRNASQTAALTVRTITLAGAGFSMSGQPSLPHQLAPGLNMDVSIRFAPRDFGSYSANFTVNGVSVLLTGSSTAAPVLSAGGAQLPSGSTVDLGLAERGTSATKKFRLENTTSERVTVNRAAVTGRHFRFAQEISTPFDLAPRSAMEFDVVFAPAASGVFEGALAIDSRTYRLTGSANEPPFPKPTVVVDLPNPQSAQQGKVSVIFSQASRAIGSGRLRMEFRPAVERVTDDEAVRFTRGSSRSAAFDVVEGVATPVSELVFQTGTTAGTIVFVAEVGGWSATATVEIAPQRLHVERARAIKNGSMLEVEIAGYDNTRTVDALSFTFFDAKGEQVQPGAIRVNTASDFRRFFDGTTTGGVFTLKAVFPVAGTIGGIAGASVELTNAAGSTPSGKIAFE